ncbi:MAG: hypothetical protein IJJ69_13640 [Oscillospiraceae bacterium]|nr:hypothetical protein [Oscillospiraceae bacterium]
MTKIKLYIPKIILTFLLIFLLAGTELTLLVQNKALTYKTFETITVQQALDEKAYSTLESYFKSRANSTGIPAEVYLNAVTQEDMKQGILSGVSEAVRQMHSPADGYAITMDFTELETSVTEFFTQYADTNNIQKDETFRQKVQANLEEAEAKILAVADTFRFGTIYEHGWFAKLRLFLNLFQKLMIILCIATAVILLCLIFCCRSRFSELFYWLGLTALISGLLICVPCLYVLLTDYFSAFVVKDLQIYSAVTGYLQYITKQTAFTSGITALLGAGSLIIFSIIQKKQTTAD